MNSISYTVRPSGAVSVFIGSGVAGHIRADPSGGFYYQPKASRQRGDTMASIELVKASLEGEEE